MTSQSFCKRWNRGGTRRTTRPRQTPRKLSLEPLEDRAVPSALGHNTFADGKVRRWPPLGVIRYAR